MEQKESREKAGTLHFVKPRPLVKVEHLTKQYGQKRALDDISFELPPGKITGLLGPNASGKTTLLKILSGCCNQYGGNVRVLGEPPSHRTKASTVLLADRHNFPVQMTPEQILELHCTYYADFDAERCCAMSRAFHLDMDVRIKKLSKGTIDKLQVCFAMSRRARLYLLDEPLSGVDAAAGEVVLDAVLENFDPEASLVIVTHQISRMERLFDSVLFLDHGKLVDYGDCDTVRETYGCTLEQRLVQLRESRTE